jgi:hypothetical protein
MWLYFRVCKGDPSFLSHQSQLLTEELFIPFYWGNLVYANLSPRPRGAEAQSWICFLPLFRGGQQIGHQTGPINMRSNILTPRRKQRWNSETSGFLGKRGPANRAAILPMGNHEEGRR